MKLTWHIVRKDLHLLWPWLALLVAAILARYFHAATLIGQTHDPLRGIWSRAQMIDDCLLGATILITALASAALVHEDAVTGDRAFWTTRPISGLRLLSTKLFTLVLALIAIPLALQLLWWITHSFSFVEITAQLPVLFARHAGTAFGAFFLALLTRNLGGFILTTLISALGISLSVSLLVAFVPEIGRYDNGTREFLMPCIAIIAAAACIPWQYLTRRTRVTMGIIATTCILCAGICVFWNWPLFPPTPDEYSRLPRLTHDPSITAHVGTVTTDKWDIYASNSNIDALSVSFTLENIPGDSAIQLLDTTLGNSSLLSRFEHGERLRIPILPDKTITRSQTDRFKLATREFTTNAPPVLINSCEINIRFLLRRVRIVARLPLIPGAASRTESSTVQIIDCKTQSPAVNRAPVDNRKIIDISRESSAPVLTLILHETRPTHLIDPIALHAETNTFFNISSAEGLNSPSCYYLRSADELIPVSSAYGGMGVATDGIYHVETTVQFPGAFTAADMARYELIKVIAPALGTFERTVTIPPTVPHD